MVDFSRLNGKSKTPETKPFLVNAQSKPDDFWDVPIEQDLMAESEHIRYSELMIALLMSAPENMKAIMTDPGLAKRVREIQTAETNNGRKVNDSFVIHRLLGEELYRDSLVATLKEDLHAHSMRDLQNLVDSVAESYN